MTSKAGRRFILDVSGSSGLGPVQAGYRRKLDSFATECVGMLTKRKYLPQDGFLCRRHQAET
jgi:hypothetical protein